MCFYVRHLIAPVVKRLNKSDWFYFIVFLTLVVGHYEMMGGVCPSVCCVPAVVINTPMTIWRSLLGQVGVLALYNFLKVSLYFILITYRVCVCVCARTVDTNSAGNGNMEVTITNPAGSTMYNYVKSIGPSMFAVFFTPSCSGAHLINVSFNSEVVCGSSFFLISWNYY